MKASEETRRLLALGFLPGVGAKTQASLAAHPEFRSAGLEALCKLNSRAWKAVEVRGTLAEAERKADLAVSQAAVLDTAIVSPFDDDYPRQLRKLADRPMVLYVRGDLKAVRRPSVAIIGTRTPTGPGREIARRIAQYFAIEGWNVVSGLALGSDTAAHEGALHGQGVTTAVLASGVDLVVPSQNAALVDRILAGRGALVSEYPFGSAPTAGQFVQRDRIQAGLAAGVVVVQTDVEGGSLHACRAIIRYGRVLAFPLPTPSDVSRSEPKIAGILKLANSTGAELAKFLGAESDPTDYLFPIRSRKDYPALAARLRESVADT